jgi:hypothetical protein
MPNQTTPPARRGDQEEEQLTALIAEAEAAPIPRTVDQVRFERDLPWEAVAMMYRQSVADSGLTMSYAERAREVLRCIATASAAVLNEWDRENLEAIGRLLIVWEGSLMLLEEASDESQNIIAARGALLDVAAKAIRARAGRAGGDTQRLDRLERERWEIGYDGDNDDGELWYVIYDVSGSVNDREWTEVARGLTLRAALDEAGSK